MRTWINVARLTKTRNLKARFVARAATGLPFLLEEGDEVAFVPPQLDVPRRAIVTYVNTIDEHTAELAFDCVDVEAASVLVGSYCLLRRDCIDESLFDEAPGMWEGWRVIDGDLGEVGTVAGLIENPAQALIEVVRPHGEKALVPVVDEIISAVDADSRTVLVNLPQGLLDL